MKTPLKIICFAGATVLLLAVGLAIVKSPPRPTAPVTFSCLSVFTSSNTSLISIGITNQSASSIVYFVGPPQLKSNGLWSAFQFPFGTPLTQLRAGQSGTAIVTTLLVSGESRVPVLWGFTYSASATRWQAIREDVLEWLRMGNLRGRGALYTNYVTDIRP
jgi:hypothetical protein